jgi:hypothetical protein
MTSAQGLPSIGHQRRSPTGFSLPWDFAANSIIQATDQTKQTPLLEKANVA